MSIKVTNDIRHALRMLIDDWGSALEVERRTGISNSTISRYLSGRLPRMNASTWNALAPHLVAHLPYDGDSDRRTPIPPHPPSDIFQRVLYDPELSDCEKVKFLQRILPPSKG